MYRKIKLGISFDIFSTNFYSTYIINYNHLRTKIYAKRFLLSIHSAIYPPSPADFSLIVIFLLTCFFLSFVYLLLFFLFCDNRSFFYVLCFVLFYVSNESVFYVNCKQWKFSHFFLEKKNLINCEVTFACQWTKNLRKISAINADFAQI